MMEDLWVNVLFTAIIFTDRVWQSQSFNVGTEGAKIFTGSAAEEFGYTVLQTTNHEGKWLLVGAPWSGRNRKGDVYKCPVTGSRNRCDKLDLQVSLPNVHNFNGNMGLGFTLTRIPPDNDLMVCGPLWGQMCHSEDLYPGVCMKMSPLFQPRPAFSPLIRCDREIGRSQFGFSAYYSVQQEVMMFGAVGAYRWTGAVVHQKGSNVFVVPLSAIDKTLQYNHISHSSLLGYAVTTLTEGSTVYFVAGAPRSNHSGQVIVYTVDAEEKTAVVDSERGKQIGSYFGSVLCSLDVDKDGVTDLLLVGAPMFMSELKREQGRVYLFSVTKGILNEQGFLIGPPATENARFGMAISAIPDLDLDGYNDVVVGAPLEDKGVIYIYNGEKKTLNKQFSQIILGSKLDPQLQYFGRSLDSFNDMNDDSLPDLSVGAYGKVVQLWSRGVAVVTTKASFNPNKINIFNRPCDIDGRKLSCFNTNLCFTAAFRPKNPVGPVDISYTLTLDADLEASRVTSRGMFTKNNERFLTETAKVSSTPLCRDYQVYVQETPDFVKSLSLKVEIEQKNKDADPVLDMFAPSASQFFIPFTKDCSFDEVCISDLVLSVKTDSLTSSSAPILVSANNRELSFQVVVKNKEKNANNPRVEAKFSNNLHYSSIFPHTEQVKCTSTQHIVTCLVGYSALEENKEVKFQINFEYSLEQLQNRAEVMFEAKSDDREEPHAVLISIPVIYDSGIVLFRQSNIYFYEVNSASKVVTEVRSLDDIGPEFNFNVQILTGSLAVGPVYLTIALPVTTAGGNRLLYVTNIDTHTGGSLSCDSGSLVDPLKIRWRRTKVSFSYDESFGTLVRLDCNSANCMYIKCILKDTEAGRDYFVTVKTRIWSGTFILATYQNIKLTTYVDVETFKPDLIFIDRKRLPVTVMISKPGEEGNVVVPVILIVRGAIGGLVLLALIVILLWQFGFFKRKYHPLQRETGENEQSPEHVEKEVPFPVNLSLQPPPWLFPVCCIVPSVVVLCYFSLLVVYSK